MRSFAAGTGGGGGWPIRYSQRSARATSRWPPGGTLTPSDGRASSTQRQGRAGQGSAKQRRAEHARDHVLNQKSDKTLTQCRACVPSLDSYTATCHVLPRRTVLPLRTEARLTNCRVAAARGGAWWSRSSFAKPRSCTTLYRTSHRRCPPARRRGLCGVRCAGKRTNILNPKCWDASADWLDSMREMGRWEASCRYMI